MGQDEQGEQGGRGPAGGPRVTTATARAAGRPPSGGPGSTRACPLTTRRWRTRQARRRRLIWAGAVLGVVAAGVMAWLVLHSVFFDARSYHG